MGKGKVLEGMDRTEGGSEAMSLAQIEFFWAKWLVGRQALESLDLVQARLFFM